MKVLQITTGTGRGGGCEQSFVDYGHCYEQLGHDWIDLLRSDAKLVPRLNPNSVRTFKFTRLEYLAFRSKLFPFLIPDSASRVIQNEQPDVVVSTKDSCYGFSKGLRELSVPNIHILHNAKFHFSRAKLKQDFFIAVNTKIRDMGIELGIPPDHIDYVPNMIRLPKERSFPLRRFQEPFTIGFLGRFGKEKGCDLLIRALLRLKQNGRHVRCLFAGEGRNKRKFNKRLGNPVKRFGLESQVRFLGWIEDKKAFFDQIDCLVVPSYSETFGIIILEAWAYGRPVIATRTDGPSEIIDDGRTGMLAEIDPESLAEKIEIITRDVDRARVMIEQGLAEVKKYRVEAIAPRIQAVIDKAMSFHHQAFSK